jgi:diguanylate cyclase (GGDEF)-like protein
MQAARGGDRLQGRIAARTPTQRVPRTCRSKLLPLSFRRRLTLFFVLIVVLPMIALAVLVNEVAGDSESGKADARLAAGLETAISVYDRSVEEAEHAGSALGREPELAAALESGDSERVQSVAQRLAEEHGIAALQLVDPEGSELAAVDYTLPFATSALELTGADGSTLGTLRASTTTVQSYAREVEGLTGEQVAVVSEGGTAVAGSASVEEADLPDSGASADLTLDGGDARVAAAELQSSGGLRVAMAAAVDEAGFLGSSPGVAAALGAFLLVAVLFIAMLTRTLSGQVGEMLEAARRIGAGDFSRKIPVHGNDEMAGLASEFNKMSDRLRDQMDELRSQRLEIERSVQRIGEAFASGLDREALLEIVVETTVGACNAEYGLIALSGHVGAEAQAGEATEAMQEAALAAEEAALRARDAVDAQRDGAQAMSSPLSRMGRPEETLGAVTVARTGGPFAPEEYDVFRYLVGQASASVENVALHEMVSQQAVTDDLTGLANNRALRDWLAREGARAERFRHDLSLLMLDIDDFKQVNDTYGHLQGDAVLRMVGEILESEARAVDQPARYGGEEFVIALPETDTEGAAGLAERIRSRIAAERIPRVDGDGAIHVTASIGVASIPATARDARELISVADAALYEAKRAGKDRVAAAEPDAAEMPADQAREAGSAAKGPAPARRR